MQTLQETFNEILFLLPDKPQNATLLSILLIHAINVKEGLKNNGINENDENKEWVGIAEGWDILNDGVYSLRYLNQFSETCQFKFVSYPNKEEIISINAVIIERDESIYTYQLDTTKLNFDNEQELFKSNIISAYKKEILLNLVKQKVQKQQQNLKVEQQQRPQTIIEQQPEGLLWNIPRNSPFSVGNQDINPFGINPHIGGNLMGPQYFQQFNQQNQQQKPNNPYAPPGARFDPFGPEPDISFVGKPQKKQWPDPFGRGGGQFPF